MALLVSYITYTLSLTSVIVRISISTNYYNYNCYYCYNGYYYYCLISMPNNMSKNINCIRYRSVFNINTIYLSIYSKLMV